MTTNTASAETNTLAGRAPRINPEEIKLGKNIRDVDLDEEFLTSVRRSGVRDAVSVYRDDDGSLVLLKGFHRIAAALQTCQPDVPYNVVDRPASNADRLIIQWEENERRKGLTTAEKLGVFEQLALDGLSDKRIATELTEDRKVVKAALVVAKSIHARPAIERADFMPTIEQAIALNEFDTDETAAQRIITAIQDGKFEHTVQSMRDERKLAAAKQECTEQLASQGIRVFRSPVWDDSEVAALTDLRDLEGNSLSADGHAGCPGHGAYLAEIWRPTPSGKAVEAVFGCDNYRKNQHYKREEKIRAADMTAAQREKAKTDRTDTIAANRAWASAQTVRRDWLAKFAQRKKPPAATAQFIAVSYALAGHQLKQAITKENRLGLDLLGIVKLDGHDNPRGRALATQLATGGEPRAQVIMLVIVLAAYEDALAPNAWRGEDGEATRYLRFLSDAGYPLSDVERRAAGLTEGNGQ